MKKVHKKISAAVFVFVITLICTLNVGAVNLGTLSYWESDSNSIGYWTSAPNLYREALNAGFSTDFVSAVSRAKGQWDTQAEIDFNVVTTSTNADILCYGGTVTELVANCNVTKKQLADYTGLATNYDRDYAGTYTYGTSTKDGYEMNSADVFVVDSGRELDKVKKTTIHEVGHSLGWFGHSSNSNNIMCQGGTSIITLNTADKQHLQQVY